MLIAAIFTQKTRQIKRSPCVKNHNTFMNKRNRKNLYKNLNFKLKKENYNIFVEYHKSKK